MLTRTSKQTVRCSLVGSPVSQAVALLDAKVPDWAFRVNPRTLDVADPETCPLGQLFGSYIAGLSALGVQFFSAIDLAFASSDHNAEWVLVIIERTKDAPLVN